MMNSDESLERRAVLEAPSTDFDEAKWNEIMSRDKLRPGQPKLSPKEEEEWIAEQIREMRAGGARPIRSFRRLASRQAWLK